MGLLASMIDQYGLMQDTQASMGNMSELIEELINRGIENESVRKNEAKLKSENTHLKNCIEQMNQLLMLENSLKMEEVDKILENKVKNVELQKELERVEKSLVKREEKYEEAWTCYQAKRDKVFELEGILKKEKDLRDKLEEKMNSEVNKHKEKAKKEKSELSRVNKDNKKMVDQNKILNDELKECKRECSELKEMKKTMEEKWKNEKSGYLNKIDNQKKEMSSINELNNHSAKTFNDRIKTLENTLTSRRIQENNMRNDLDKNRIDLKDTKAQLEEMTKKAEDNKKLLDEYIRGNSQTLTSPPVAIFKEPEPYRKAEEEVSIGMGEESTSLQSTGGGTLGDTEDSESTPSLTGTIPKSRRIPKIRKRDTPSENQSTEDMEIQQSSRRSSVTSQIDLETLNKRLEEQNIQIKTLEEQLQNKETDPTHRKEGPSIETITPENSHKVSPNYPGLLMNADGSLSKTQMSEAWSRFPTCQLEKRHESTPPKEEPLHPDHPNPTFYDSTWSREGEWI